MTRRALLGGFLLILCLVTLGFVWIQSSQLANLRAEHQQLLAQLPAQTTTASASAAMDEGARTNTESAGLIVTPELLRLRSEVTRLSDRKRELASVSSENERLRAQLASRGTNISGGVRLPPDYIRKSEARLVGYNRPEDTLQSLLWALQSRDLTNVLQAFTPERAESLLNEITSGHKSSDEFFRNAAALPGMRVVNRTTDTNDGSVALQVEIFPGMEGSRIPFRQQNGEWKIAGPF